MQKIRRATKKHRTLILVIVVLLCVGMVASFSFWNSENDNPDSYADYAKQYQKYINSLEKNKLERTDYETAVQLYQLYYSLYMYSMYAYYLETNEPADLETSNAALLKAVEYAEYAAVKYGAELGEASYDDALVTFQHYYDAFTFNYYLCYGDETNEHYQAYCDTMKTACEWMQYAVSIDDRTLETADYEAAAAVYQNYSALYGLAKSYYEATEEESYNELYKSSIYTAYSWLERTTSQYDDSEQTVEGATTQYQSYNSLAEMAQSINEELGDAAYGEKQGACLIQAYDWFELSIERTIAQAEEAEGGVTLEQVNNINSMYKTLAELAGSIYTATGDEYYSKEQGKGLGLVCDWYGRSIEMTIANAEAAEGGMTAEAAQSIHSMYSMQADNALSAYVFTNDSAYNNAYNEAGRKAIEYYKLSMDLTETPTVQMYVTLSELCLEYGDNDNARVAIDQALAMAPQDINVVLAHGDYLYTVDQDTAAALSYLNMSLEYYAEDSAERGQVQAVIDQYSNAAGQEDEAGGEGEIESE